jgi:hypothetical protein
LPKLFCVGQIQRIQLNLLATRATSVNRWAHRGLPMSFEGGRGPISRTPIAQSPSSPRLALP